MYYPVGWSQNLALDSRKRYLNENGPEHKEEILDIQANSERNLILIVTNVSLRIWFCKPCVEIVVYTRNKQSIESFGSNVCANWKPDSSIVAAQTCKDFLLFFKIGMKDPSDELFHQEDSNVAGFKRESAELFMQEKIPALYLVFSYSTKINRGISRIMSAEEAVVVCTKESEIIGVNWDGTLYNNFNFKKSDILPSSISSSTQSSVTSTSTNDADYNIIDIKYSAMIGGFSIVFANGKGGFLPLYSQSDSDSEPKYRPYRLRFVPDMDNCVCTAINHRHQLLSYGLRNSEAVVCCIDEINSTVLISHRLVLSPSSFPNASSTAGSMSYIQWSPDSNVIATSWENGGFAIWTVFGALVACSLSWDFGALDSSKSNNLNIFGSLSWGCEGYQLWMSAKSENSDDFDKVNLISMAKSVLACNPSSICSSGEDVLLISEDRLYLGAGAVSSPEFEVNGFAENDRPMDNMPSTNSKSSVAWEHQPLEIGNHQWIIIQMPISYLVHNWPIRLAAIDNKGSSIAIAGSCGFAHYNMVNRKWKMFGNEVQEKDFEVRGGLLWWNDYIIMSCYNLVTRSYEIRTYPQKERLDNQFMKHVKVPAEVLHMSMLENQLLLLLLDGSFHLYGLDVDHHTNQQNHYYHHKRSNSSSSFTSLQQSHNQCNSIASAASSTSLSSALPPSLPTIHGAILKIRPLYEIVVQNLNFHPECLTSIVLSDLHYEPLVKPKNNSILLNDRGRLYLLEKASSATASAISIDGNSLASTANTEINGGDSHSSGYGGSFTIGGSEYDSDSNKIDGSSIATNGKDSSTVSYRVVAKLASRVENIWIPKPCYSYDDRPHLTNALWLSCGINGMGVWLPLLPSQDEKSFPSTRAHNFMSKRIMLPINTHIYPLAVLFRDAVVLGAENDTIFVGKSRPINLPFSVILRTSQVYLHHILRGLLRQNLGLQAWEIANSCVNLPYFPHSLELLLHEVLEEEATSSQPIPDALLPRVIEFIREFPFFLETVVHCARKTELALWPHLFSVIGPPKDLFQQCLDENRLETAASFIIILQNLEKGSTSKQYAAKLLENVKSKNRWQLAKELTRFLSAIDPSDKIENGFYHDSPENHKNNPV